MFKPLLVISLLTASSLHAASASWPVREDSTHFSLSVNGQRITLTKTQSKHLIERLRAGQAMVKDEYAKAKRDALKAAKEKIDADFEKAVEARDAE